MMRTGHHLGMIYRSHICGSTSMVTSDCLTCDQNSTSRDTDLGYTVYFSTMGALLLKLYHGDKV
jgi:hypothetical protein